MISSIKIYENTPLIEAEARFLEEAEAIIKEKIPCLENRDVRNQLMKQSVIAAREAQMRAQEQAMTMQEAQMNQIMQMNDDALEQYYVNQFATMASPAYKAQMQAQINQYIQILGKEHPSIKQMEQALNITEVDAKEKGKYMAQYMRASHRLKALNKEATQKFSRLSFTPNTLELLERDCLEYYKTMMAQEYQTQLLRVLETGKKVVGETDPNLINLKQMVGLTETGATQLAKTSANQIFQTFPPDSVPQPSEGSQEKISVSHFGFVCEKNRILGLNMGWKKMHTLPTSIGQLTHLRFLDLANNAIEKLPDTFGNLAALEWLDLTLNQIQRFPDSICNLTRLKYLKCESNRLEALPEKMGQLINLEEAIIENNRLTKIPESISKMTNLNAITFKSNKIVAVPPMIGQLPKLKALNLSFNAITKIPNEIGQIKTLTSLNFAWNQIAEIPPALKELKSLQFLWLDKNLLKEIPEFISELNLSTLSLAENQLSTLPYHLWVMDGLQTLKLEKNPLSTEEQQMTQNDAQTIRNYCRQRACISVMLIYTEADKVNHRISEIIEFLENQKEIYTVLQPEILNLPSTDLLLFLTTAGSIKSSECLGILKTAKDQGISVVPLKGLDIGWGDLAGIGLSRELGHEFTPKDFTGFCGRVYEYIQRFKRTHNIFKDKRAIVLKEREKPGDPSSFVMFKEVILQLFQSNEMKTYFSMLKDSLASDYERSLKGQNNEVIFFNQMLMYLAAFMGQQRDAQQSSKGGF